MTYWVRPTMTRTPTTCYEIPILEVLYASRTIGSTEPDMSTGPDPTLGTFVAEGTPRTRYTLHAKASLDPRRQGARPFLTGSGRIGPEPPFSRSTAKNPTR